MMRIEAKKTVISEYRKKLVDSVLSAFNCSNEVSLYREISHIKTNFSDKNLKDLQKHRKKIINRLIKL